mgnify:CR=1 FL=1|jgi:hypothetical protein
MRLTLTLTGAVLATAMLALATPASAQSGAPPTAQQANGGAIGRTTGDQQSRRFETDEYRTDAEAEAMTVEEAEAQYGAERVALAERVQALMDAGQCTEARRVASEAGERAMAIRVRQTCRRR